MGSSTSSRPTGVVHAVDLGTGIERWRTSTGAETHASPSIVDGLVIVAATDGAHAFSATDGSVAWVAPQTGLVRGCPAILGHTAVFASDSGTATALDTKTGAVTWTRPLGAPDNSSVAAADGLAVFGLQDGVVVALAIADGASDGERTPVTARTDRHTCDRRRAWPPSRSSGRRPARPCPRPGDVATGHQPAHWRHLGRGVVRQRLLDLHPGREVPRFLGHARQRRGTAGVEHPPAESFPARLDRLRAPTDRSTWRTAATTASRSSTRIASSSCSSAGSATRTGKFTRSRCVTDGATVYVTDDDLNILQAFDATGKFIRALPWIRATPYFALDTGRPDRH